MVGLLRWMAARTYRQRLHKCFSIAMNQTTHSLWVGTLPAPRKMDVILMACGDVQVGVHFHGSCSPGLEVGSMRGFGHMVQQPSCHMAQLMAQSSLQLVSAVYHLCAQLYPSTVPATSDS